MSTPSRASSERRPLTPSTNEARAESPTLFATAKTSQSKYIVRQQISLSPSFPHLDSSESIPSAQASIYEALIIDQSTDNVATRSEENIGKAGDAFRNANTESVEVFRVHTSQDHEEERRAADEFAWNNCVPAIHSPHRLEPITEKNSLATLQTKASKASCRSAVPRKVAERSSHTILPLHQKLSNNGLRYQPSTGKLHRKSFSLPSFSRRSDKSSSSSITLAPSTYLDALPKIPKRPPPERKPTPPGLPTFNTPAAINYRLPAPPARFRDHFRPSKAVQDYRRQTRALPRGVVMRGDNGELIRGRWRATPSGHGIVGQQHPWLEAEETMTRYSGPDGGMTLRPNNVATAPPTQADQQKKTHKWWDELVFMCCGVDRGEDGGMRMHHIRPSNSRTEPLFVGGTNTDVPNVDVPTAEHQQSG